MEKEEKEIEVTLRVKYSYSPREGYPRVSPEAQRDTALSLAVTPNFHTIADGVTISKVEILLPDGEILSSDEEEGESITVDL